MFTKKCIRAEEQTLGMGLGARTIKTILRARVSHSTVADVAHVGRLFQFIYIASPPHSSELPSVRL